MLDVGELAAIAALSDGQRRRVFALIQSEGECTVAAIATALSIGRTLVTFHLTKLVEAGLVEVLPAQKRPGVPGRPSQSYRLTGREISASVPHSRYDLLAGVLLDGLAEHRPGESAQDSADRVAHVRGKQLARQFIDRRAARSVAARLGRLETLLTSLGYVPRRQANVITLRNCPFDKFRPENTPQVCQVNLALAQGYVDGLDLSDRVSVELRPCPDNCCVAFTL
ncbi:MAG: helix-turn-helix domain-containing protein [Mycobacteriales bacterium]